MINGLEGIPGSGKSYEATVYHVLEALKQGRMVVTNLPLVVDMFAAIDPSYRALIELRRVPKPVRGTWDATRVDEDGNGEAFQLFADGHTEKAPDKVHVFGHVWDYYHEWRHPKTKRGPLYVIDECHVPLPKAGTDPQVVEWFKLHRHYNADVLLMTQNFRDMCNGIATLLAILIRCRSADFLGKKGEYVRKVFAGFRGALVSSETRKYLPEFFPLYKSHTQGHSVGESSASDVQPFIVKWKRAVVAYWVVAVVGAAWWFWPSDKPKKAPVAAAKALTAPPRAAAPVPAASAPRVAASGLSTETVDNAVAKADEDPEPLRDKGVHLRGRLTFKDRTVYLFVASQNGQAVQEMTDADLRRAGYEFRPMSDCMGALEWKGKVRPVSCDLPAVQIVNDRRT